MADLETRLRLMTTSRDVCLEQIRRLEEARDYARRMDEAHIERLESENSTLRKELDAAKIWQAAFQKVQRRRVVSGG